MFVDEGMRFPGDRSGRTELDFEPLPGGEHFAAMDDQRGS
jgi:hypothetical protein